MLSFLVAFTLSFNAPIATPWSLAVDRALASPAPAEVVAPAPTPAAVAPTPDPVAAAPRDLSFAIFDPQALAAIPTIAVPTAGSRLPANAVVSRVQKFYKGVDHLRANFRQTVTNKVFGNTSISDGKVYIKKPGKMRWDYYTKKRPRQNDRSFISDGKTLWAVFHQNLEYYKKNVKNDLLPVAITFLSGKGDLRKDFNAKLDSTHNYGKKGDYVLELTPKRPNAQYKTLWLVVDPENFRVKESVVLNSNGDTNQFRFFSASTTQPVKDSWFVFNEKAPAARKYRLVNPPKNK